MRRRRVERELSKNTARIKKLREHQTVLLEQRQHFDLEGGSGRHVERLDDERRRIAAELARLDARQDELLDEL